MIDVKNIEEFETFINSEKAVCALFTADWCPDCQVIKPVLPELEEQFKSEYEFISLNRDRFLDLCQEQNVFGIPSFISYKKGSEIGRFVSKDAKTRDEIESYLRKTLEI